MNDYDASVQPALRLYDRFVQLLKSFSRSHSALLSSLNQLANLCSQRSNAVMIRRKFNYNQPTSMSSTSAPALSFKSLVVNEFPELTSKLILKITSSIELTLSDAIRKETKELENILSTFKSFKRDAIHIASNSWNAQNTAGTEDTNHDGNNDTYLTTSVKSNFLVEITDWIDDIISGYEREFIAISISLRKIGFGDEGGNLETERVEKIARRVAEMKYIDLRLEQEVEDRINMIRMIH